MTVQLKYHLLLPKTERLFNTDYLTFTINHIRSRHPSVLYFIFHCFDINGNEIYYTDDTVTISHNSLSDGYSSLESECAYVSDRGAIGTVFSEEGKDYNYTFPIGEDLRLATVYTQLEIVTLGVDSENPLYFSEMMLQESRDGEDAFEGYHVPNELTPNHYIDLTEESNYANLYNNDGDYLQVIRPNKEDFSTNILDGAKYTILAPHFKDDEDIDNHVSVFLEAMNQTEQVIDVLR